MHAATFKILVRGKVQGVFFRASAKNQAIQLKLKGWVKNLASGDVEALISGRESSCEEFITWCNKGPVNARVEEVIVTPVDTLDLQSFSIKRDD